MTGVKLFDFRRDSFTQCIKDVISSDGKIMVNMGIEFCLKVR